MPLGQRRTRRPQCWVIALFGAIGWFLHPVFGWVGGIFDAVGDGIDSVPADLVQVLLTVLAVGVAANWIRRFLTAAARRPASPNSPTTTTSG